MEPRLPPGQNLVSRPPSIPAWLSQVWITKASASKPLRTCRKERKVASKPGMFPCPGMSLGGACRLPRWRPAWRWRERGPGSRAERVNLRPDGAAGQWSGPGPRPVAWSENPERQKPRGRE